MPTGLKFWILVVDELYYVAKTKALISRMVTVQLICAFVFAYTKHRFSHDMAHIMYVCPVNHSSFHSHILNTYFRNYSLFICILFTHLSHFIHTSFILHSHILHTSFTLHSHILHTSFTLHSHIFHTSFTHLLSHFIHTTFTLHSNIFHTSFTHLSHIIHTSFILHSHILHTSFTHLSHFIHTSFTHLSLPAPRHRSVDSSWPFSSPCLHHSSLIPLDKLFLRSPSQLLCLDGCTHPLGTCELVGCWKRSAFCRVYLS